MRFGEKPYCLVLSGGGAKGVYHIGVWRALRELGIPVNAFVGNSIGAIIAGFLAQGAEEALEEIGRTITIDTIVNIPEGLKKGGRLDFSAAGMPRLRGLLHDFSRKKGFDTSPMRELLGARLDEARIRKSGKDLGIVTVNLSDFKPREIFLDEMEEGRLIDYLMASSAMPGFAPSEIDGKKYVDGGWWDNIPYSMARKRGYTRIIVVDISGFGVNRHPDIAGSTTIYIKNSIAMGGVLDFDRNFLDSFTELGYLDTMRVFGRFKGYSYFIKPNEKIERRFRKALAGYPVPRETAPVRFPLPMRYDRDLLLKYLECAAVILSVPRIRAYTYESLAAEIDARLAAEDSRLRDIEAERDAGSASSADERRRGLEILIRESLRRKVFDETPYHVLRLLRGGLTGRARTILETALMAFWPSLEAGINYIEMKDRVRAIS